MGTNATQSKNSSTNVVAPKKGKVSFNDMPTDHDHVLSSGSHLRRVCCSCNAPREFSTSKCNSCKGKLVIRYRKVNATVWTQPRMPPNHEERYVECQDFQNGKCCFKRCNFAHGQDQLEIWELCRVKGKLIHVDNCNTYQLRPKCVSYVFNASIKQVSRCISVSNASWVSNTRIFI